MQWIGDQLYEQVVLLRRLWRNKRFLAFQALNLAMIVLSALMIWKGLMALTMSESPVVVVLSGSMEPAFRRGDILVLNNVMTNVTAGDIVVFKIEGRDVPIVHRVLREHIHFDGSIEYLTKGDNNNVDDRNLYAPGQLWLTRNQIQGKAIASIPHLGMVTILLNDYPILKFVLLGVMAILVLTGKSDG
jgi:signal peptidase